MMQKKKQIVNIINFIRGCEPREEVDLEKPVREQMALLRQYGLPGTFLLQYDALCQPAYAQMLKEGCADNVEFGVWLEIVEGQAEAAGIPVIAMRYNDFSDYLMWFKVFANLTGHTELWDEVALKALDEVVDVLLACPTENTPSVFSMFSSADNLQANTSGTVVGGMIDAMHAKNIVDEWEGAAEAERLDINLETVFAADPDIILVQCHAGREDAEGLVATLYGDNPVWQSLTAVQNGKVFYLEKSLFHNKPNSRFAEAYKVLAGYLYPGLTF